MKRVTLTIAGLALATAGAQAQDTQAIPPDAQEAGPPTTDQGLPPDPDWSEPAAPADGATVSEVEVDSFAEATVKVQEIEADATLEAGEKQSKMAEVLVDTGLDAARYNEIAEAASADPELRARIEMAMARHAGPSEI